MEKIKCLFCERARKNVSFYLVIMSALLMRVINKTVILIGQKMKISGKKLVEWGSVETPRWTTELLRKAHMVDAEIHTGGRVFRGPLYAMYRFSGEALVLCLNWVNERSEFGEAVTQSGSCSFRLEKFGHPHLIKGSNEDGRGHGNLWFMFKGGWVIIYLGDPKERLVFQEDEDVPRVYAWY